METKLKVIVDNIPFNNVKGEWGLSILVEHNDKRILVDTGSSNLFAENLKIFGIDINDIDLGVISHAHYDHSNGMKMFFTKNSHAKMYLQEKSGENCYFKKFFIKKYIGIPHDITKEFSDRIEYVNNLYSIDDKTYLLSHSTPGLSRIGKRENMYIKNGKKFEADDFSHEQSLVLDTSKGLVIINSCSHGGVLTILNEVEKAFPGKKIYGLIGGFHLFNKSQKEIKEVAQNLADKGIDFVCTGHCTKDRAYNYLKEKLGDKLEQLHVGLDLEF